MHYNFIEIGTSDFDTLIQTCSDEETGLSIEPISYYLNRLPDKKNVKKINAALSDKEGEIEIYNIPDEEIKSRNLPWWVRGSNSVNKPHQHTINAIGKDLYDKIVHVDKVPTITWQRLIEQYEIESIDYLKIDTEGFDHVILKQYLKQCEKNPTLFAKKIKFEYYSPVSDIKALDDIIPLFTGYDVEYSNPEGDITLTKKEKYEKAYVLYCTESYLETTITCAKSIRTFSNIPIIIYTLNFLVDEYSPLRNEGFHLIYWGCNIRNLQQDAYIDRANPDIYKILIQRSLIVKDALEKYADTVAYIDSDCVATKYADNIFSYFPTESNYPYFVKGIYDYMLVNGKGDLENPVCRLFNVTIPTERTYRQTGFFVAGQNCILFLEEWYWMCNHPSVVANNSYYAPFDEETILQPLLYKWHIEEGLPYLYTNASYDEIDKIYSDKYQWGTEIREWFKLPDSKEELLFIHREKDPEIMKKMIEYLSQDKKSLKILFLEAHLSTGGAPQFCLKRIEALKKFPEFEIFVVEYQDYGAEFVVQKNKIKAICKNFFTLGEDKVELIRIISNNKIDIVHIDETIEFFHSFNGMPASLINQLYSEDRTWKIVETCHNIAFQPATEKKWHPDAYSFCTPYHLETFASLPSLRTVIEYPIDKVTSIRKNIKDKLYLKLYPEIKHVLNVGLWTEGKNQKEGLEIARKYPDIQFHFVGNMAGNFKSYWEPLMKDLPTNVKIWGERNDVEKFYKACDIFMFNSTYECNPVVLREAISYGLPIIAHNLPTYRGMFDKYIQPIDSELVMLKRNYKIPTDNTTEIFGEKHVELYRKVMTLEKPKPNPLKGLNITQYFVDNPFIEITGESNEKFDVKFYDENDACIYAETIGSNHWIKLNRQYYTKWRTEIKVKGQLVYQNILDYTGKRVFIVFESSSLGDTIAWIPYVEEFRKKHSCHVIVCTYKNFLFKKAYPQLEFVEPGTTVHNLYGLYRIGWFYDSNKEPVIPNTVPLQQTATNILGLEYKEIKPEIDYTPKKRLYNFKYVAIATNSTSGCKYWKKEEWQKLCNYLISKGYKVINVSKEKNPIEGVEQITNVSIENTMHVIYHSKFMIGLSSGLSWLAWSMNKQVVMIAGFSAPDHEFTTNCIRIHNPNVCNNCWNNANFKFDKGDYNWCPIWKNTPRMFECQNSLTTEMIINRIQDLIT